MLAPLPPNSCLVAILLVTETRAGSRVVFHYPPAPSVASTSRSRSTSWYGTPATISDLSSSESDSDSDSGRTTDDGSSHGGSRSSGARHSSRKDASGSVRSGRARGTGPAGSREVDTDEDMPERHGDRRDKLAQHDMNRFSGTKAPTDGSVNFSWNRVLGFDTKVLSRILSPSKTYNKRRFEFGLDHLVFLGAPRFVRDDGLWKKGKKGKKRLQSRNLSRVATDEPGSSETPGRVSRQASMSSVADPKPGPEVDYDDVPIFGAAYGHDQSGAASEIGSESRSASTNELGIVESDMTMFNLVFVMNPAALEYQIRVDEMYDNVVKKIAKALKYAQAVNNYVYQESRAILAMKQKAEDQGQHASLLWSTITQNSSLARAIVDTFTALSENGIAHVNLGQDFDASFQLPQPVSTSTAPTPTEPQMPGLWLTTATPWEDDETDTAINPNCALLLLQDDTTLLNEVRSDAKELSGPLTYFISNLTPEKSLLKVAQKSSLTIKDVQLLARHLIYWRRGRAIPPLRERDTYTVSPNADISQLKTAIPEFAARFPLMGSLPAILQMLSQTPRPWHHFFPSRTHRQPYMEILAWLLRHGWVTQLRTFAWVRVPAEVKVKVAQQMSNEKRHSDVTKITLSDSPFAAPSDRSGSLDTERAGSSRSYGRIPSVDSGVSPLLSADRAPSETGSVSSGRTAVTVVPPFSPLPRPSSGAQLQRPTSLTITKSPLHENVSNASESDDSPRSSIVSQHLEPGSPLGLSSSPAVSSSDAASSNNPPEPTNYKTSIIHSPQKASPLESRWIEQIGLTFDDSECRELWPILLKYFDGKHAFEDIYVKEGLKKKLVAAVLHRLSAEGWLLTVRHW